MKITIRRPLEAGPCFVCGRDLAYEEAVVTTGPRTARKSTVRGPARVQAISLVMHPKCAARLSTDLHQAVCEIQDNQGGSKR